MKGLSTGLILAIVLCFTIAFGSVHAAPAPGAELLQKADQLYTKRTDTDNVKQALKLVEPFCESGSYEALWRAARCNYWLGHKSNGKNTRLSYFEKGKDLAEKAVAANPNGADGHYWVAANIGKAGIERGILNSLMQVKPMKAALDKVLAIDSGYADAHRVLSELYAKVPGWPVSIGDSKKAVQHAEAALKARPNSIRFLKVAAEAYLDAKDRKAAKACLENLVKQPLGAEEPEDDKDDKEWALKQLKDLKD